MIERRPLHGRRRDVVLVPEEKSPILALVLSFIVMGLGQIYAGQVARGLFFMIGAPVVFAAVLLLGGVALVGSGGVEAVPLLYVVAVLGWLSLWVFHLADAYSCAEQANREALLRARRRLR